MNIERELKYVDCISDLNNENDNQKEFIKCWSKDTAKHYLVGMLQDKRFAGIVYQNICKGEVNL